jgi:hypothetical protein
MKSTNRCSHLSHGVILTWHLATHISAEFLDDCIRPKHFLLALCRITEVPLGGLPDDVPEISYVAVSRMEHEVQELRQTFVEYNISVQELSQQLQTTIEITRQRPPEIWHRCPNLKRIFAEAFTKVDGERDIELKDILEVMVEKRMHQEK